MKTEEIRNIRSIMERKITRILSDDLGFLCIMEGDKQKIIDNFEQQIGLSANLEDFSKLASSSNVSTFYLCTIYGAFIIKYLFACLLKYWFLPSHPKQKKFDNNYFLI